MAAILDIVLLLSLVPLFLWILLLAAVFRCARALERVAERVGRKD